MSWNIDTMHSQVNFSAKHMGIMTVRGHFTDLKAELSFNEDDFTASTVEATISAASLVTNDAKRDEHLRTSDFLEVDKYPEIIFKSTKVERGEHDRYRMAGDLTIRGVTRPVTLDVVYSGQAKDPWGNTRAGFNAQGVIKRSEWGISFNAILETGGVMVSDEVKIEIEVEAVKPAAVEAAA